MVLETSELDFLHKIGTRMASGELHEVGRPRGGVRYGRR